MAMAIPSWTLENRREDISLKKPKESCLPAREANVNLWALTDIGAPVLINLKLIIFNVGAKAEAMKQLIYP
jgi:hypothetical protein